MLLVGAGLLVKSFARLLNVNPGFSTENVLTAQMSLPVSRYADPPAIRAFWDRLVEQGARDSRRDVRRADVERSVQRQRELRILFHRRLHARPERGRAARPAGSRRGRLLQGDADPARRRAGCSMMATPPTARPSWSSMNIWSSDTLRIAARSVSRSSAAAPTAHGFTIVGVVGTINSIDLGQPVAKERLYDR